MLEDIKTLVRERVAAMAEVPVEEIAADAPLEELGIDSLMALELLVTLQRSYRIEIAQEDLRHFTSVNSVAELTLQYIQASAADPLPQPAA